MGQRLPLRIFLPNFLLILGIAGLVFGGVWITAALAVTLVVGTLADELVGDSLKQFGPATRMAFTVNLYATLPLIVVMTALFAQTFSDRDVLGIVAGLDAIGIDFGGGPSGLWSGGPTIAAIFMVGMFYAIGAFVVGHELIHWRDSRVAMIAGRFLLAVHFASSFSIAHVYCHHREAATFKDPVSARRFERFLPFFVRSVIGQLRNAYRWEAARLRKRGYAVLSWRNVALRGELYSLAILAFVWWVGGLPAILAFLAAALFAKLMFEANDYIQHYGLVRLEGTPIHPRHSWDCYRAISSAVLYNLPRHAEHHNGNKRAWELNAGDDASPMLPFGYKTMALVSLVPPLFDRLMNPRLADWDARFASPDERRAIIERGWSIPAGRRKPAPSAAGAGGP